MELKRRNGNRNLAPPKQFYLSRISSRRKSNLLIFLFFRILFLQMFSRIVRKPEILQELNLQGFDQPVPDQGLWNQSRVIANLTILQWSGLLFQVHLWLTNLIMLLRHERISNRRVTSLRFKVLSRLYRYFHKFMFMF